jgi:pimeloyl-ACP methyl ester carboxylesterase
MTTLCMLPGLLCDAFAWGPQIAAFEGDTPVHVADFRGFACLTEMARAVLDTVDGPLAVAGHSMGGRVALEMQRLAPERIERLALLDTGVHSREPGEAARRQVLVDLAHDQGMAALADRWLPPMVGATGLADADLMAGLRAMVARQTPAIFEGQVHALLDRPDAAPQLGQIACPVLVGVGRDDGWSPLAQHQSIAAAIPAANLVIFEDSGHMAPLEAPQAVTRALEQWLWPQP